MKQPKLQRQVCTHMFRVKNMSAKDFAFTIRLTDTMDWNLTRSDLKFMTELEPDGCFVILDDSKKIGLATTISFDKVGWLGNVIVSKDHRGRGAGSMLVRHSVEYLKSKDVETIGLYAYIDKIPFYRRLGFEYGSEFIVLKGKGSSSLTITHVREAGKNDLQEIVDLDRLCFGASRRKLLEPLLSNSDNLCYMSKEGGQLLGFVVAKVYEGMAELGPLACRRGCNEVAVDLLRAALNKLEGFEVSMCIPEKESTIVNTLMRLGLSEAFRVAGMFHGPHIVNDCIYVAESLERG